MRNITFFTSIICLFLLSCDTGTRNQENQDTISNEPVVGEEYMDNRVVKTKALLDEFDTDTNGQLGPEEFSALAEHYTRQWDTNEDGMLDQAELMSDWAYVFPMEFREGWFQSLDENNDGMLSETEFQGLFTLWDVDNSNALEEEEMDELNQ